MQTEPQSLLTLKKWKQALMNSVLNRCGDAFCLSHMAIYYTFVNVSIQKNTCLFLQENMAISCGSRSHLEKESVAQVIVLLVFFCLPGDYSAVSNHCCVFATEIHVSHISYVWISLPGVVLLCERDQRHAVRFQAFHTWGCTQDVLISPCRAMVRIQSPPQTPFIC